ncbi:acyltransferase [uncultured Ilyobacter sp.]|uniref:acyltransferase n=1 Tax=uncultured Ilyobacter sp. TaxID=544433 RepID=UPI0029C0CC76|nr:acyltransferase [uncultured Ilyobacter sp.]
MKKKAIKVIKNIFYLFKIFQHKKRAKNSYINIKISQYIYQKFFSNNRGAWWPLHFTSKVVHPHKIRIGIGTCPGEMPGCYIQGIGGIDIGDFTRIAPNVGIISANHDWNDYNIHNGKRVEIGSYCWIGMNAVIMPGVKLGDHTIVGAGSVVTKSFEEGYCVVVGNPARVIKALEKKEVVEYDPKYKYEGFLPRNRSIKRG